MMHKFTKAIWSRKRLDEFEINDELSSLFYTCVGDLLDNDMINELQNFSQHMGTSRLQHSINVSYYSFLLSRKFCLDFKSAARAGILHDFFLYKWDECSDSAMDHVYAHPKAALDNALKITDLNIIEADAILHHMWPLSPTAPKYRESYIVSMADKMCTCMELIDRNINLLKNRTHLI